MDARTLEDAKREIALAKRRDPAAAREPSLTPAATSPPSAAMPKAPPLLARDGSTSPTSPERSTDDRH